MAMDNMEVEYFDSNGEETKVDLEGELVSPLEEIHRGIHRLRKKNKTKKELQIKDKAEAIKPFLLQIEKAKKIQETLNQQLNEKNQACGMLEGEMFLLRKKIEKVKNHMRFNEKFGKGTESLNELLDAKKVSNNRVGVGFDVG